MRVTIQNIASQANVSSATVSRVLNKRDDAFISEATRERVLAVAQEMGYRPNRAARALVTGRSHVVAMWMTGGYETAYFSRALYFTQSQASRRGYEMLVSQMGNNEKSQGILLSDWPVDGILAFEFPEQVNAFLDMTLSHHPPLVNMGAYYSKRADFVGVDYYVGAVEAVQHLVALGARRIAYLVATWGNHPGDARYDAYAHVMQQAGRPTELIPVEHSTLKSARPAARQALRDYIQAHGCPDALFCFSDDIALGAYRALCDLRIRVPEEIALVGCDGIEDTEYLECPLSTIVPPQEQVSALAWEYLERRIENPTLPLQQTILPSHLVIRESSKR